VEQTLCRWARADHKPLLAICRGVQMLNVAWGGTLFEDIHAYRPAALNHATKTFLPRDLIVHTVGVELDSLLARWLDLPHAGGRVSVNSRHHQAIRELAPGLRVTARAPDGIIEAVEGSADGRTYAVGVQWHPENMVGSHPAMRRLFVGFCALCSDWIR
jgi:putative glutamine amidotransferase